MVAAFTFPGQGSQCVGMGKALAEQFIEARAVFEEVDDALQQKLSAIMFDGPEDQLTLTANAQPALMAVSLAVLRVMQAQGFDLGTKVKYVAGHSLGEYSALCAAGMFSLSDTAKLLRIRGNAMQAAVAVGQGAMAAIIGLSEDKINSLCQNVSDQGTCQIANDNGASQIVISGAKAAVEAAVVLAKDAGAKRALLLPVSAPFHSTLMQSAAQTMQEALCHVQQSKPSPAVVSNVTVAPENDPERIVQLLVQQVTGRVRWRETVEWFSSTGIDTLYEVGTGKVLSGLARRINKDMKAVNVYTAEEIENALKMLDV